MKTWKTILIALAVLVLVPLGVNAGNLELAKQMVGQADPYQAMALANQWKWTRNNMKTYVTPREVVFEFPDGVTKKVALPADKMVVAIAPYLTYTHG